MSFDNSVLAYFLNAGLVVKFVMMLLLMASILSWTLIFQRYYLLKSTKNMIQSFEEKFWSGGDMNRIYHDFTSRLQINAGIYTIFTSGFREFSRLIQQANIPIDDVIQASQRAMRVAQNKEMDRLNDHLATLATVGSTSPYVGLFGTVWGIMTSFHALGTVQQATISMVAPGISEALVATAMGLFAAIPAVIAYNRFATEIERVENHYDTFQDEFLAILYRQASKSKAV